jgi:ribonuclease D
MLQLYTGDLPIEFLHSALDSGSVAVDIETDTVNYNGLDWRNGKIAVVSFALANGTTVVVRGLNERPTNIVYLMRDHACMKILHHARFDIRFMYAKWGVYSQFVQCTKVAAKLLDPNKSRFPSHSLQALLDDMLGIHIEKGYAVSDWTGNLTRAQLNYAREDVAHLHKLHGAMVTELFTRKLDTVYIGSCQYLPTRAVLDTLEYKDVFTY